MAPDGQHHGGLAEQADVVPAGMGLPPLGMDVIGAPGGPAVDGQFNGQFAGAGLAGGFEDVADGPDHPHGAALVDQGIVQLPPSFGDAEKPFEVHVGVRQAIDAAVHGTQGAEHRIDDGGGNDVAVLGGDALDPGPAGADAGQAGTQQLPAGHVVLVEGLGVLDDVGRIGRLQHAAVGDEAPEQIRGEEGAAGGVEGHHRPRKMQIWSQLEFQSPIPLQGQAPAVLLHQVSREAMAVVADQGVGAPIRHHLHVWVCQDVSQPGQGGADVRVGVVTDEPANGAQIGDGAEFGEGAFDGERGTRIDQDPVRTVGNEIGVALEMVIRQTHSNPPHTGGNFDGLLL
jgi:hypothetical protein